MCLNARGNTAMQQVGYPGDEYVLNFSTKHLSRAALAPRPDDEASVADFRAQVPEAWRFPIIGYLQEAQARAPGDGPADAATDADRNLVTFVYKTQPNDDTPVKILGTFATLYETIPLEKVKFLGEDTGYRALSVVIPKGELHTYKFLVGNRFVNDPINPQQVRLSNGQGFGPGFSLTSISSRSFWSHGNCGCFYRLVERKSCRSALLRGRTF